MLYEEAKGWRGVEIFSSEKLAERVKSEFRIPNSEFLLRGEARACKSVTLQVLFFPPPPHLKLLAQLEAHSTWLKDALER